MTTIRNLIRRAYRQVGIIAANEDISSEDLEIARSALSSLMDSWSTNPNIIWEGTPVTVTINTNDSEITLASRPVRILDIIYRINTVVFPMRQIDQQTFYRVSVPQAGLPSSWMWNGGKVIKFIGRGTGDLQILVQMPLVDISTDVDLDLDFPPGYENAIMYNLALMLCEDFGRQPSQTLFSYANAASDSIISPNYRPTRLNLDSSLAFGRRSGGCYIDPTSYAAGMN